MGLVSVTLLASSLAAAGPAAASNNTPYDKTSAYCSVYLPTGDEACFSSLEESAAWAQDEALASGAPAAGAESAAMSSFLLAKLFEDKNKQGWVYSIYGDGPCDNGGGWEWQLASFSAGHNNEVSSFQGYSNCEVKLYENPNFNNNSPGSTYGPYASSNDVGAMNDASSSARFY